MRITNDDVRGIARLARLELAEDEIERLREQIGTILTHVATLEEIAEPDDDEPSERPTRAVVRADAPRRTLGADDALDAAPDAARGLFRLPRMIDP